MALTKVKLNTMVTGNLPDANIPDNITITNAATATALQNARTINGTSFDGSANITVTSAAGTLTGNTLASGVTASSLTSVGTLTSLNTTGAVTATGSDYMIKAVSTSTTDGDASRVSAETGIAQGKIEIDFFNNSSTEGGGYGMIQCGKSNNTPPLSVMAAGLGVGAVPRQYYKLDLYKNGNACILGMRSESHGCTQYFQTGTTVTGQLEFSTSQGWLTTRTASPLKLGVNNATKMTIAANGNTEFNGEVLISGTSDSPLAVRNTSGGEMFLKFLNTNGTINGAIVSNSNANTMAFRAGGNTFLSIDGTGQPTFQTTTSNDTTFTLKKTTNGGGNASLNIVGRREAVNSDCSGINFKNTYSGSDRLIGNIIANTVDGNGLSGKLRLRTSNGGSVSDALVLNHDTSAEFAGDTSFAGNVTISKSSPKMTIFASNTGDQESLVFDRNTASNGDSQEIKWKLQGSNYPGGYIRHEYIEAANSQLEFGCRENNTVTKMMTIGSSGDIQANRHSFIVGAADERRGFMFSGGGGTNFGYANVQGSGYYGMVFGRESIAAAGGAHYIGKSHWGGISIIGFSGSGVQGIDIVAWGYGNGGATVLKSGNWIGSLYRSYSTVNYYLAVDVGTDVTMWSILIGI